MTLRLTWRRVSAWIPSSRRTQNKSQIAPIHQLIAGERDHEVFYERGVVVNASRVFDNF